MGIFETPDKSLRVYTVESPNNGHVGDMASVCCRELSASRRLLK